MNMNMRRAKILSKIGQHPEWTLDKLAEKMDMNKTTVTSYIYGLRKHYCIIESPPKRNEETGYVYELTGKGNKELRKYIRELMKDLNLTLDGDRELHIYRPPYNQKLR